MLPPEAGSTPRLVAVTANAADCAAVMDWIAGQAELVLSRQAGFYAAITAVDRGEAIVVTSVDPAADGWRLAELRTRAGADAIVVVVADATLLPMLAGALRADIAVTETGQLPPLRELAVAPASSDPTQTMRRRSTR